MIDNRPHDPVIRKYILFLIVTCFFSLLYSTPQSSSTDQPYVTNMKSAGAMTLSALGQSSTLFVSSKDHAGVLRVARNLQDDIERVTQARPELMLDSEPGGKECVVIGTIGKSPLIDKLVNEKKLDVGDVSGKWEVFLVQVIEKPFPGTEQALVIAGSDKRGTIFGMYDLSAEIGVSPWYWWADVPAKKQKSLYVLPGRHSDGEPAVRYRGIFINDEAPALSGWAYEKFGGFNHSFYEKVFELIQRLKGNYLWPAMWGRAFYVDDPINPKLADEYGVVIGTSHHEPMMRAHAEWGRGPGTWNYQTNEDSLKEFWKQGIKRMDSYESLVTVGMRGDGDEPMSEGANIALLERIVKDQRQIIGDVTGKDVTTVPQVWALYKEVQEYYDKGMRVPNDVTLLLCDDNWGNIRKLPKPGQMERPGGYGIYYHYDYVGGPRNYKWLNTNQISRVWDQMHLAYEYGAHQLWIVNVGDIKPMEFPISFFLDYAWNPSKWPASRLPDYTRQWAAQQFGSEHSAEIAEILTTYTKYNSRRKPELLSPKTYSLVNYGEAETVVAEYNQLAARARKLSDALPPNYRDAYYQLVLHPVLACSNLNELYVTAAKNHLYAQQGRSETNKLADKVRELFAKDAAITEEYNTKLAGGKWNHFMDQTHIGYTYWQQPDQNTMPEVKTIDLPVKAGMGVAIEGSEQWWPDEGGDAVLPEVDSYNRQSRYIELFNRGKEPFRFSAQSGEDWVGVEPREGNLDGQEKIRVTVDWSHVPTGTHRVPITVMGPGNQKVIVTSLVRNSAFADRGTFHGFVENDGYVSIEGEHYTTAFAANSWLRIPDLGRTLSGVTTIPAASNAEEPGGTSPHLEYKIRFSHSGEINVNVFLSPTLNFHNTERGLRYAVSINNDPPQIVSFNAESSNRMWEQWVANNINITRTSHMIASPGDHILKFWKVDPGVVLQKIVVETTGARPSYLGPPESYRQ